MTSFLPFSQRLPYVHVCIGFASQWLPEGGSNGANPAGTILMGINLQYIAQLRVVNYSMNSSDISLNNSGFILLTVLQSSRQGLKNSNLTDFLPRGKNMHRIKLFHDFIVNSNVYA